MSCEIKERRKIKYYLDGKRMVLSIEFESDYEAIEFHDNFRADMKDGFAAIVFGKHASVRPDDA